MNIVFISPHYPKHFYQFCARLKERGATVLGIGDCPWEGIGEPCRQALTEYRSVPSLQDYEAVYRIFADFISRYGRIDFVESENEYWLELDARLRTDFNITTGPKWEDMAAMNRKSRMKEAYARAGIPAAQWTLPETLDEALAFAQRVGYPVIVKPDKGVGAASTYRIKDDDGMRAFWAGKPDVPFIEEELVPGHVETFDGVTDSRRNVLFCASQSLPVSLMDAVNRHEDVVSYCQAPDEKLREAGERVLREFDTRNKFFHFEFFRLDREKKGLGRAGDIVGLEVNMRAPGGRIPDKMNFAYDTDVYTIWADSLLYDRCFMSAGFKHFITHVGRKNGIAYAHGLEDVRMNLAGAILEEMDVDPALAGEMGDHAYLIRSETLEERERQVAYILEREGWA